MEQISSISVSKLEKSRFLKPIRMNYEQNGVKKVWDLGLSHQSVAIIIHNKSKESLVLVKQLRPAVLFAELLNDLKIDPNPGDDFADLNAKLKEVSPDVGKRGITLELCAGIVDKPTLSLKEIAQAEVEEECGFKTSKPLEFVQTFRSSIGTGGQNMTLFYAEVTEEDRVSSGGGIAQEGEMIEVVEMSIEDVKAYLLKPEVNCPTFTLYGLMWFLQNKC